LIFLTDFGINPLLTEHNKGFAYKFALQKSLCPCKCTFIPSWTSTVVYIEDDDSILIIPSGPIFSIASAMRLPTYSSLPDDIEATAENEIQNYYGDH